MKEKRSDTLSKRLLYAVGVSWWVCLIRAAWFMTALRAAEAMALSQNVETRAWGRCRLRHLVDYIEYKHPHWCFRPGGWLSKQLGISIIRASNYTMECGDAQLEGETPAAVARWQTILIAALEVDYLLKKADTSLSAAEPKQLHSPPVETATATEAVPVPAPLDLTTMPVEEFVEVSGHR